MGIDIVDMGNIEKSDRIENIEIETDNIKIIKIDRITDNYNNTLQEYNWISKDHIKWYKNYNIKKMY